MEAGELRVNEIVIGEYTHKERLTGKALHTEPCLFFDMP